MDLTNIELAEDGYILRCTHAMAYIEGSTDAPFKILIGEDGRKWTTGGIPINDDGYYELTGEFILLCREGE